ncbi:MFS transporter [Streptomyces sp. NPDC094468]|uniref:MFS transporter n=1 Tax=Streptomyces sp. NPDC094468 TaxID=3366066 RepID=UPI003811B9AC
MPSTTMLFPWVRAAPAHARSTRSNVWLLIVGASALRAAGYVYPFLSYRLGELGFSPRAVSGVLTLFGVGWLAGQILWGQLADTLGRRTTLVGAMTLAAVVLPLLAETAAPVAIGTASVIAGMCYDAPRPVISAVVSDEITDRGRRASITGWRHFGVNVGAAVTGASGGLLADQVGLPFLFWANAAACAAFAIAVRLGMPADQSASTNGRSGHGVHTALLRDGRLWLLWLASVLALTPAAGLFSILPLLMASQGMPAAAYGWTQVASAAAVLLLSIPLNGWLKQKAKTSPMVGLLAVSSLILGAGIGAGGLAASPLQYAAAAAAAVPGEIIAFVAASAALDKIAPPHARGLYAGIWGSTLATAVICAPLLAGWSLTQGGPHLVALSTFACGALGALVCLPLALLLPRDHPSEALQPASRL